MLSLGSWPTQPIDYNPVQLTPITKRIISQVRIDPKEIIPLSFQQYRLHYLTFEKCSEGIQESYELDLARRRKKAAILTDIRMKYIIGKEDGSRSANSKISKIKSPVKADHQPKSSRVRTHNRQERDKAKNSSLSSKLKSSPKLTLRPLKVSSPKTVKKPDKQSQYFTVFNPKKRSKIISHVAEEQQSTKSKHLELKDTKDRSNQKEVHQQYGFLSFAQQGKPRHNRPRQKLTVHSGHQLQHSELELCQELLATMERLEQLTKQHQHQMDAMRNVTAHERERLCKIHQIEKGELQSRLQRIKSRLQSHFSQF